MEEKPRFTPEDKARFEAWLKQWSHQLGSHWSVYTLVKAAFKHATLYERQNKNA